MIHYAFRIQNPKGNFPAEEYMVYNFDNSEPICYADSPENLAEKYYEECVDWGHNLMSPISCNPPFEQIPPKRDKNNIIYNVRKFNVSQETRFKTRLADVSIGLERKSWA